MIRTVTVSCCARRLLVALVALASFDALAASTAASTHAPPRRRAPRPPPPLVWHVETLDGDLVETNRGDEPLNPASVVKIATSWWALEKLGPDHRFETAFLARGTIDPQTRTLRGDLV